VLTDGYAVLGHRCYFRSFPSFICGRPATF
jgi:hypothetical protein